MSVAAGEILSPTKVAILTPTDPVPVAAALSEHGGFEPLIARSAEELEPLLPQAEGLVIGGFLYRDIYDTIRRQAHNLKWVQLSASGYEIYQEIGAPEGVRVMRAVGVWGPSVAGHALALLLGLARRLPEVERARAARDWARTDLQPNLISLAGRRILLVGHGDIGGTLAPLLRGLGAQVTIVAHRARSGGPDGDIHAIERIDDLLPEAEMMILTVPSNPDTLGLFDRSRLERLARGALVVNVGRGEVVDETALADLLVSGHLGGAGLDVFEKEPLPANSPLWSLPNVILSPHTAAFGDRESLTRLGRLAADNATRIAAGEEPVGLVGIGDSGKLG